MAIWSFPTTIVFDPGALAKVREHLARVGITRPLIVTDPTLVSIGLVDRLTSALGPMAEAALVFSAVDPNPIEKNVVDGARAYAEHGADGIVCMGGGSALDAGKVIAVRATHDGPLEKFDDAKGGDQYITAAVPPIVAIPTTAGTGSEVGRSGVVTLESTGRKTVIFSPHLLPRLALLDPELTIGLPKRTTAATGFDALTHAIEAHVAKGDHPLCDAIALGAIELCATFLDRATRDGADIEARGGMMKAAAMGAIAFQKGLGACHSLAHPLSSENGLHHGLANAICLPSVVRYNEAVVADRNARIQSIIDPSAASLADALEAWRERLGLPGGLQAEGVSPRDIDSLAEKAFEDACHLGGPRSVTSADLAALYRESL